MVKQMPKVEAAKQPTIAIITSQYFEKMAVDAMMTNRQTFVRYATVGEWECVKLLQKSVIPEQNRNVPPYPPSPVPPPPYPPRVR